MWEAIPCKNDVVCARGRAYWDHPGNIAFRKYITLARKQYSETTSRIGKSYIVSEIIATIRNSNGQFVKKIGGKADTWIECDENLIREKVSQSLRDSLSFKYSSSTMRKRQRKAKAHDVLHGDIDRIIHSNSVVSWKIKELKRKVDEVNLSSGAENDGQVLDEIIMTILDQANLDILETIKMDRAMMDRWNRVHNQSANNSSKRKAHHHVLRVPLSSSTSVSSSSRSSCSPENSTDCSSQSLTIAPATIRGENNRTNGSDYSITLDLDAPYMFLDETAEIGINII